MKKTFISLTLLSVFLSCAKLPIMSDLTNNRITVYLKGTYETNTPYDWNTNLYSDDALTGYPAPVSGAIAQSNIFMYLDIADIRLSTCKDANGKVQSPCAGKPAAVAPLTYWTYFAHKREVFCSNNYANGNTLYKLLSCVNEKGDVNYNDLFTTGYNYEVSDLPQDTYKHLAIFFRKFTTSPSTVYDINNANGVDQATSFDNRTINGINLMDSILQYAAADTSKATALLFPLERTDLSLTVPAGRNPYVLEIRLFLKNLMMKHVIAHAGGSITAGPQTFIGPSDWRENHNSTDLTQAYQMGNNLILTARIYDPATVGSIRINDTQAMPVNKSYYAVVSAGAAFDGTDLPYAATSRTLAGGTISNLPAGSYDLYRTCDQFQKNTTGIILGQDGYPETVVSCAAGVVVTAGNTTVQSISCANTCP